MATIRKRGNKWQVQVRRKGCAAISRTFILRSDAQAWARETEIKADRGEPFSVPRRGESALSLATLVERYRDHIVPTKRGCVVETIILNAFLRSELAATPVRTITAESVARYRDARLKKVRPATINRELGILRHAISVAKAEWGLDLDGNPFAEVRKPQNDAGRTRRLRPDEIERLQTALDGCRNKQLPLLVALALETAMRRGELLNVRWSDVNERRRTLFIPETKNGHPRTIPLTDRALAILRELRQLGPQSDDRITSATAYAVRLGWDRAIRRAQIKGLRFHDLRHEAISRFFELGLSTPEVALISGHRDARMLMRYTHLRPDAVAGKIRLLSGIEQGAMSE